MKNPTPTHWHLSRAKHALAASGVIAYPTETVYGLGADPLDCEAVSKLLTIKNRSWEKGLILIAAHLDQLLPYIKLTPGDSMNKIKSSWPGPFTWVFEATDRVPPWVKGRHSTIAVRVTSHPWAAALCNHTKGPIISTSANPSGLLATQERILVKKWFHHQIDYFLPGTPGPYTSPSEIRDARSGKLIRQLKQT